MLSQTGTRPTTLLASAAIIAAIAALATLMPAPHSISLPDREAERAWGVNLKETLGPVMADCVRFEIAGHVPANELDAILARASGDPRLSPYLSQHVSQALARCKRRHVAD